MRILVTGGAGFIGSALVRFLINNTEHQVINVDKLTYAGNLSNLDSIAASERYSFEKIDICDSIELARVFDQFQPEAIMHLAAESHVDRSIEGPADFINTNVIGTFCLLECARKLYNTMDTAAKNNFRFHHISTDEVYGDLTSSDPAFTEENNYEPSSPYSASKASSDHLVRAWHRTYGLPILLTNCSNNYGPFHFPEKLIPQTILNALAGKEIPVYGDGKQIRDWLYVEDHVEALYTVLTTGRVGETYNIGGCNEYKNIDVVNIICETLAELTQKNGQERDYKSLIKFVKDRPGHDLRYAIDSSKISKELNWQPKESFETGLRKTVQWFLNKENLCKKAGVN